MDASTVRPFPHLSKIPNRLSRLFRRLSRGLTKTEQVERWQALDAEGAALERLMASPDWTTLERRREVFQRLRTLMALSPMTTDDARRHAVVEWNTLQDWFHDLHTCVREGKNAREALAKVQAPQS